MTNTGYARTSSFPQRYRANLPERHATGDEWQVMEVFQATPPTGEPWHAAAYCVADVDDGTVGELRLRSSAATETTVAGTGSWTVDSAGLIRDPAGNVLRTGGMNGGAPLALGTFGDPTGFYRWAFEGLPNFNDVVDIWPGYPNGSPEQYPGGLVNAGRYFSSTAGDWVTLDDKVWSLTGAVSAGATTFGIASPRPDHWHCRLYRMNCHLVNGANTWSGAPTVTAATSIPQFVARVEELRLLGLIVVPEDHDMTGTDPTLPAGLVTTPTLASGSVPAGPIRDMLDFYDALCTAYPGGGLNVWLGLPNEPYTTGVTTAYTDFVVTMVRRIRAKGFGGIISIPLGRWAGDLAGLARGDYAAIQTTLNGLGVGWSLVWEWHNYGKDYYVPGSATNRPYTYAELDAHLAACRTAGRTVWMSEYGQAVPAGTGAAGTDDRTGVDLIAGGSYPLAAKYPELCPTWWSTADNTFVTTGSGWYSLTLGPGQTETTGTDRRFPWWDIDGTNLELLTEGGRKHWDAAHIVSAAGLSSLAVGVSPPVVVSGHARNVRLGFEGIPNSTQLLYVEGRKVSGPGGVRLVKAAPVLLSAPPAALITGTPPAGGGGGGGGTVTAADVRSTFVSDDQATSFTVLPSWFSPPVEPGDKVVLMGFAPGPSENATHTWTFPGADVFTPVAGGAFHPRAKCTVVDYNAAGWTCSASNNFRMAAICFRDTLSVVASTPVQNTIPADPGGVSHGDDSVGVVVNCVNFTTATITSPTTTPGAHSTIISKADVPRQVHAAKIARPTAGTYDPGVATVAGTGAEQTTVFALVAQPTVVSGSIPAPTVPAFTDGTLTTLSTLSANIASVVAAAAPGDRFQLVAGTYTNWSDVRPKSNMHFKGPASGVAVLEGTGFTWAFRAIDATGSSDNVTISGPVGSIKIQNYGSGTTRAEYGAIQAQPTNTSVGSTEFTYGCAQGWFIQGVELSKNGAQGIRISDYCTLYQVNAYGHTVSGVGGDRNVGGLWHSCTLDANGLNPATGAYSNGAEAKVTFHNASAGRTQVLTTPGTLRAKAPLIIANTNGTATKAGVTGTANIGLWLDLDCQDVQIYDSNFTNHPWTGFVVEGCNNIYSRGLAVTNSDGYSTGAGGAGEDFILGAITVAESTNVIIEDFGVVDSVRAVIVRQSNRSSDWYNANNSSFVNFAWPTGPRYWLTAGSPSPIPGVSDQSNMWSGNITFRNGLFTNCNRVLLNEGSNGGGMSASGSLPLGTIVFDGNDYASSPGILFYDRSNTGLTLTQWKALPYTRDQ